MQKLSCGFYECATDLGVHSGVFADITEAIVHAMEANTMSVTSRSNDGYFLWEFFPLTMTGWLRIFKLMELHHPSESHLLWTKSSGILFTQTSTSNGGYHEVWKDPTAVSTLAQVEYLWRDLDAVQAFVDVDFPGKPKRCDWVRAELCRRKQWLTGLRRAWLVSFVF